MNFNCALDWAQIFQNMFVFGISFSSVKANVELNIFNEYKYTTVQNLCWLIW